MMAKAKKDEQTETEMTEIETNHNLMGTFQGANQDQGATPSEPENGPEITDEAATPPESETAPAEKPGDDGLVSIEVLASDLRLPSWQTAALNRLMEWETGKRVTREEYLKALQRLKNRRLGG